MLINKKTLSTGDVASLKLVNGDEIIARYESEDDTTVKIAKPLALTMGPQGLGMIPWVFLGDSETFTLAKTHIFVMIASKKDAADQYIQNTTNIALR